MWTLKLPENVDAISNITTAFNYADGKPKFKINLNEIALVKEIYENYEKRNGVGHEELKGIKLGKELLNAFEESYNEVQKNGRLKGLRNRLMANARKCPSCEILPVNVLDHYLPQSLYKVLSIYSSNIIPYCQICNLRKLASSGADNNQRFIHAYYDVIPADVQFLFARVWVEGMGLQCNLIIHEVGGVNKKLRQRMEYQIKRVNLEERILDEIFDILIPMGLEDTYEAGGKIAVRELLYQNAKRMKNAYGLNSWKHAIIQAMSCNEEICDGGFKICLSMNNYASRL